MMTARDPYVNVMRGAMAAFSAGLGGADSVSVLPHTLAVGLPDSLARRLARNAQLILLRESHLGFVADPAAGAGAFEALTKALCERAWALFQEIEGEGGLPSALAERRVPASGRGQRGGAGARCREAQVADHRRQRARRSRRAAGRGRARRARARSVRRPPRARSRRFGSPSRSSACATSPTPLLQRTGSRPRVYLAALGPEPAHRGRVAFVREWLEAGGFEAVYDGESATAEEAVERLKASGAPLVCLCGDDEAYAAQAEAFAEAIKAVGREGPRARRAGRETTRRHGAPRASTISSSPAETPSRRSQGLYRRHRGLERKRRGLTTS